MGLFPFFTDEESDELDLEDEEIVEDDAGEVEPYREYEIDPDTGRFTGRILEGTEAILTWVILTLKSERYEHEIYSWEYGEEFSEMIGNSYEPDLLQSETKRMVEEALLVNASFDCQRNIGRGVCDFTDDGSTNMALNTGATSSLGNGSGNADSGVNGKCSVSYRGEENLWGNIWTWLDLINILAKGANEAYRG